MRTPSPTPLTRSLALAATFLVALASVSFGQTLAVIHGEESEGNLWGIDRQLERLAPERGELLLMPSGSISTLPSDLDAVIRFTVGTVEGDGGRAQPPSIVANRSAFGESIVAAVFGEEHEAELRLEGASDWHAFDVLTVTQSERVPPSRRNHWNRAIVAAAMQELGMIDDAPTIDAWLPNAPGPVFGVYDAEGTGGEGVPRITRIVGGMGEDAALMHLCGEDVRAGALDGDVFDGVLFPGGGGGTQGTALGEEGRAKLTAYIERGGGYIGICAGAYLATCRLDNYLCLVGTYHHQPWRKGRGMVEVELSETGQRILGEEFAHFESRFANGLLFMHEDGLVPEGDFDEIEVWAYYRSAAENPDGDLSVEMIDAPAIVASTHGAGRLLLISPHPETHPELDPMMERAFLWTIGRE